MSPDANPVAVSRHRLKTIMFSPDGIGVFIGNAVDSHGEPAGANLLDHPGGNGERIGHVQPAGHADEKC
jgi:hypothetical protein